MNTSIKDGIFYLDGCSTVELANKYGTPLYVMSETSIVEKCRELKDTFINKYERTRVAYAGKAFLTLAMCRIVQREGMCLDVVSGGELYTALKAEFPPEKIEFNGNNKSEDEIRMAVSCGVGRIIIDGLDELEIIERICSEESKRVKVLYRITPGVKSDSHDYIVTGRKDSKFGIPLEDNIIFPAVENAIKSEQVEFMGFHFHVGSQLHDNASHLKALDTSLRLVKETYERFGYVVPEINIGGGYGIKYTSEEESQPYSYFLDPVMKTVENFCRELGIRRPDVVIEPGRSIAGEAGMTLYTVGTIKDIPGIRKYVSIDGGMTDNIRPALYQAKYDCIVANKADLPRTESVTICGKCCESGDVLIRDVSVPPIERNDILAVYSTGAYGYSMANNYNKNPVPAVVLVHKGTAEIIVRRQTYESMIANEEIPESLRRI